MPPPLSSRGCHRASRRWADCNVAAVSHGQHVPTPTAAAAWHANTAVSKAAWRQPFDLESGVQVTCDVGYLCANFGLPRPLFSRLRADVRDRQTSDKNIMPRLLGAGHNNSSSNNSKLVLQHPYWIAYTSVVVKKNKHTQIMFIWITESVQYSMV